jgi:hypothetical protein
MTSLDTILQASKMVGAGMATCGLIGAGTGVGIVFGLFNYLLCAKSKSTESTIQLCANRFCPDWGYRFISPSHGFHDSFSLANNKTEHASNEEKCCNI